jgi:hypothetical protein
MYEELKKVAAASGISAFGVGSVDDLREHFEALSPEQTEGLNLSPPLPNA